MTVAPLITASDLRKEFVMRRRGMKTLFGEHEVVRAVNGVSLSIAPGETFGLVGESGSGKSTVGRMLGRLLTPTGGSITFDGDDWLAISGKALRRRRRDVQMVFQNPFLSLDPRWSVEAILAEPLRAHAVVPSGKRRERVVELLQSVGLGAEHLDRYPHQFSGGQRQRIGIARAIASEPRLLIADEPVSALDVSVQAQVLTLLTGLKQQRGFAMLFISHDLSVVRYISDRVGVMYLGELVETGPTRDVFAQPNHPYTAALLSAVPQPVPGRHKHRLKLEGEVPSVTAIPSGCPFAPRCAAAEDRCRSNKPLLRDVAPGRQAACHFPERATALLAGTGKVPAAAPVTARDDVALPQLR